MGTALGGLLLIGGVLFVIAGVVLLVRAFRGRKINDHVVCRRCRFDLSGLGELKATLGADGAVIAARCPECGSEVWKPGSVRVGQRRRAPFGGLYALVGAMMLVLGLAGVGVYASQRLAGTNWYARLPNWVLIEMADGWLGGAKQEVMDEVVNRLPQVIRGDGASGEKVLAVMRPGSWTNAQLGVLASRAAKGIESTSSKPMIDAWLRVYREAMWTSGLTTDEQSASVAAAAMRAKLTVRSIVRQGEPLYVEFEPAVDLYREFAPGMLWSPQSVVVQFKRADGSWSDNTSAIFNRRVLVGNASIGYVGDPGGAIECPPGEYEVKAEGVYVPSITIDSRVPIGGGYAEQLVIVAKLPTRTVEWTGTVKVVPRRTPAMDVDVSPEAVRDATSGARVAMLRWKGGSVDAHIAAVYGKDGVTPSAWDLRLLIDCPAALCSVPRFLRVVVQGKDEGGRAVGQPWMAIIHGWESDGVLASGLGSPNWRGGGQATSDRYRLDAPMVDILIEPHLAWFEQSMHTRAVGARLRFTNVRVQDQEGSCVNFNASLGQLSKGQYRADAAGQNPAVSTVTGEELVRAVEEDRAAWAAERDASRRR